MAHRRPLTRARYVGRMCIAGLCGLYFCVSVAFLGLVGQPRVLTECAHDLGPN